MWFFENLARVGRWDSGTAGQIERNVWILAIYDQLFTVLRRI